MSFSNSLKEKAGKIWEDGYHHPFVQGLGRGTLPRELFQFYLMQDYHYLLEYAKVYALAAVKAEDAEMLQRLTAVQYNILAREMDVHRAYMTQFGVREAELRAVKPALHNRTYTSFMLAVGQTGGLAEMLCAVLPCAWTYYDYASRLKTQYHKQLEENRYRTWITNYSSQQFKDSFHWFFEALDRLTAGKTASQLQKLEEIFRDCVAFEYLFWEMSYQGKTGI